ncbi:MAG: hypothetical protein LBT92_01180 [Rickettsiales bacterium]|jgi:DNA-binding protein H-NS|nr:hypothetical protein [Rickettsiales bacterium]
MKYNYMYRQEYKAFIGADKATILKMRIEKKRFIANARQAEAERIAAAYEERRRAYDAWLEKVRARSDYLYGA